MHSTTVKTNGSKFTFHFNSDFSGDVLIYKEGRVAIDESGIIRIPCEVLLEFIAYNYILPKKIQQVEEMSVSSLFNNLCK